MSARPDKKALTLAESKLETSGLTFEDAKILKVQALSATETANLHKAFKKVCSLKINYLGPEGTPLADIPQAPPFYRLRYLESSKDFKDVATGKSLRYVQEPNTAPVAYYPQNFEKWGDLVHNIEEPLIITEGELKAAKACKEGFPTLGIGGVFNWRSNKLGIPWIPSLELVDWVRRNVYICFDSDYKTNPMVCSALKQFADQLERRGAFCHIVSLPQLPGLEKVGLDDFLVNSGPRANDMFGQLLSEAEPLGLGAPLWEMNNRYVYIRNPGLIINLNGVDNKVSPAAFKEHLEATTQYQEKKLTANGEVSYKSVSAAAAWLKWPLRLEALKLTYRPGQEKFVDSELNIWPGWGVEPKRGNVKPFLDLLDHLFTGTEKAAKQWLLKWLAYPLQHPGTKMFSSAVVHGIQQGTGKSLVGYTMGAIYGKNFTELSQFDLHEKHNEWAESRQFVLGDDVTGSNKRADADFLKKMITQREIRLNPKHIRSYVIPDCINYYFTSNQPDAFFLEDNDRRFFIHEVLVSPKNDEYYTEYSRWLYEDNGAEAVFYYLLHLDLTDFNPASPAYKTAAKDRMINTGRSDLASWVRQLQDSPDEVLMLGEMSLKKDLYTSKELLELYDPTGHTGTTANGLARELSRAGFRQVLEGRPIKVNGHQVRLFAVRNTEDWLAQTGMTRIVKHVEKETFKKEDKF